MSKFASPYYPPRARWHRPRWNFAGALRRHVHLDRVVLPGTIACPAFVGGLLVPGLAFYVRGGRLWGKVALAASGVLFAAFIVWLGYPAGNLAFGLLLSIHSTGVVYLCEPLMSDVRFRTRIFFSMASLLALGALVYMPMRHLLQERCFMPMNVRGHVVIVRAYASIKSVRRRDWIAYTLKRDEGEPGIYMRAGYGLGPVLATAGDRVKFGKTALEVNGVPMARQAYMPDSGELVVPENNWFVWPEVNISYGHGVGESAISATVLGMAVITKEQFIGKPFKRWFWRRQIMS